MQWAAGYLPDEIGNSSEDYDDDGLDNITEYGLDGDPTDGTQASATLPTFTAVGGGFEYIHPERAGDSNLVYTVETTENLVYSPWAATGYTVGGTEVTGGTLDFVTNSVDTVADQKFIRLKIEQN